MKTLPLGVGALLGGGFAKVEPAAAAPEPEPKLQVSQGPSEMMTQDKDGARRYIMGVATEDAKQGGFVWVQVSGPATVTLGSMRKL